MGDTLTPYRVAIPGRHITASMLNMLPPTILPTAISLSPWIVATTDVATSGKDVPAATIVSPIIRSMNAKCFCDKNCVNYKGLFSSHSRGAAGECNDLQSDQDSQNQRLGALSVSTLSV